jgi:hypothetical protein
LITENFKLSGKVFDTDWLHIWSKGRLIKGQLIFRNLVDTSTHPKAFFDFWDLIIFSISLVDVEFNLYL